MHLFILKGDYLRLFSAENAKHNNGKPPICTQLISFEHGHVPYVSNQILQIPTKTLKKTKHEWEKTPVLWVHLLQTTCRRKPPGRTSGNRLHHESLGVRIFVDAVALRIWRFPPFWGSTKWFVYNGTSY